MEDAAAGSPVLSHADAAPAVQASYMKNLFTKLHAGTRKQVVQRARILGLLEASA